MVMLYYTDVNLYLPDNMGIQILYPDQSKTILLPFTKKEMAGRKVYCRCNLDTQKHNLEFGGRRKNSGTDSVLLIVFSVSDFRAIARTGNEALKSFARNLNSSKSIRFSPEDLPLDAALFQSVNSIIHYEEDPELKQLYLYSRVLDLLRLQQLSFVRAHAPKLIHVKNEYDKERILFARDYLLTHLDAPPGLIQLAAIAGINEFKLKRGFKELFDQTVFGYLAEVRLEMARRALLQKQKNVTQIAFELGYASLQHFSASFKKKFGVSPREFG